MHFRLSSFRSFLFIVFIACFSASFYILFFYDWFYFRDNRLYNLLLEGSLGIGFWDYMLFQQSTIGSSEVVFGAYIYTVSNYFSHLTSSSSLPWLFLSTLLLVSSSVYYVRKLGSLGLLLSLLLPLNFYFFIPSVELHKMCMGLGLVVLALALSRYKFIAGFLLLCALLSHISVIPLFLLLLPQSPLLLSRKFVFKYYRFTKKRLTRATRSLPLLLCLSVPPIIFFTSGFFLYVLPKLSRYYSGLDFLGLLLSPFWVFVFAYFFFFQIRFVDLLFFLSTASLILVFGDFRINILVYYYCILAPVGLSRDIQFCSPLFYKLGMLFFALIGVLKFLSQINPVPCLSSAVSYC